MRHDLDTDILVDLQHHVRATEDALARIKAGGHLFAASVIVIGEFYSGCNPGDWPQVDAMLDTFELLDVTPEVAMRAARYRIEATRQGRTLHLSDALIAATARLGGASLLTRNTRDFALTDVAVVTPAEVIARR